MRRLFAISSLLLSSLLFQACGGDRVDYSKHPALTGLDPVALLGGEKLPGSDAHAVTYEGFLYHFANAENKATFEADPESYRIQGDGSCIVSPGAQSNPDIYLVHEGKIYIFASTGCVETFLEDPQSYVG